MIDTSSRDIKDELQALDTSNIIATGRRTRGIRIDYTKAKHQVPEDEDSEDEKPKKKKTKEVKPSSSSKKQAF